MPYDRDKLPWDIAILGGTGALGYGRYRLGDYMVDLSKRMRKAFRDAGVSDSSKVNDALLDEFRTLRRSISTDNPARNAYTYADIMHRAANMPLFEGGKALGTKEGLGQFNNLIHNVGETIAPDIYGKLPLAKRVGRILGIVDKDGIARGFGGEFDLQKAIDSGAEGTAGFFTGGHPRPGNSAEWRAALRHFDSFMTSPLDGYRQLVSEANIYGNPWKFEIGRKLFIRNEEIPALRKRLGETTSEAERETISKKINELERMVSDIDRNKKEMKEGHPEFILDRQGTKEGSGSRRERKADY